MTTNEVKRQLRPCPFCGDIPIVIDNGNTSPPVFMLTHKCAALGHWSTSGFRPAKPLIAAWNMRYDEPVDTRCTTCGGTLF